MVQLFNDWPHFARKWKEGEFAKRMHDRHANEAPMKASIDALRAAPTGSDESGAFGALLQVTKSLWRGLGEGDFLKSIAPVYLEVCEAPKEKSREDTYSELANRLKLQEDEVRVTLD